MTQPQEITLANLHEKTEQQVFEYVVRHLLTQNAKAIRDNKCMYRTETGLRCAAGCLIDKDNYDNFFKYHEGTAWGTLVLIGIVPQVHCSLIEALQTIHDQHLVEYWKTRLASIGTKRGLDTTFLNDFPTSEPHIG